MKRIAWIALSVLLIAAFAFAGPEIKQQNSYDPGSVAITGGTIDGATIGGTSAGKVQSRFEEIVSATSTTLTLQQSTMTILNNYGQSANNVIVSLPTAAEGYGFTVVLGTGVAAWYRLDPVTNDQVYLDGSSLCGNGKWVGISGPTVGNCISCATFQTGAASYDWMCLSSFGTWVCE
jgi:hypothetical protein